MVNGSKTGESTSKRKRFLQKQVERKKEPSGTSDNVQGEYKAQHMASVEPCGNKCKHAEQNSRQQTSEDVKKDAGDESSSGSNCADEANNASCDTNTGNCHDESSSGSNCAGETSNASCDTNKGNCHDVDATEIELKFHSDDILEQLNLHKNENGKYEWQWRNENGWDEGRKHESTNLQDVLSTWNNEKGFIIKIKDGYKWILLEECINDKDTTNINTPDKARDPVEKKAKIIFIGPIGSGKSATINTLLGKAEAPSENNLQANSLTKGIEEYNSEYGILVDTPGLTDEYLPSVLDYLEKHSPDVIVFVFAVSRLRSHQNEAIKKIQTKLETYFNKAFLLLTKGIDIQDNEHDFIDNGGSEEFRSLYCSVGKRCVVFENWASMEDKQKCICKFKDRLQQILIHKEDSSTIAKSNLLKIILGYIGIDYPFRK